MTLLKILYKLIKANFSFWLLLLIVSEPLLMLKNLSIKGNKHAPSPLARAMSSQSFFVGGLILSFLLS